MSLTAIRPCEVLSLDAHLVFHEFTRKVKDSIARTTLAKVADSLSMSWQEVRQLIDEISDHGLAKFDNDHLVEITDVCRCSLGDPLRVRRQAGLAPRGAYPNQSQSQSPSYSFFDFESGTTASDYGLETETPSGFGAGRRARTSPEDQAPAGLRRGPDPAKWNARDLVLYLQEQVALHWFGKNSGGVDIGPTVGTVHKWIKGEGRYTPQLVKAMIDLFVSDDQNLTPGTPAWKVFIRRRDALAAGALQLLAQQETRENSTDASHWSGYTKHRTLS